MIKKYELETYIFILLDEAIGEEYLSDHLLYSHFF